MLDEPEMSRDGQRLWWVEPSDDATDAGASSAGLEVHRRLLHLRRALPMPAAATQPIKTRPFRPGTDDDIWLGLNAAAFGDHPDQGGWTTTDLQRTLAEVWFDPAGFLLLDIEDQLAGFCWTKVHPESADDVRRGEIFIIGVHPAFHGRGLGRALTSAGLDWLWHNADVATAMLYVEANNQPARSLYASMGFQLHSTRTAYREPTNT